MPVTINGTTGITTPALVNGTALAFRNKIINGNFDIWQRGTSLTSAAGARYLADRFTNGSAGTTYTASRQSFALGQTDVPNEPSYFHRSVVTSVAGASNNATVHQHVEFVRTLAGSTATLTFYAKADATKNIAVELYQNFGTGGTPSTNVSFGVTTCALTTSWQKFTVTANVPSISGKTIGTDGNDSLIVYFWLDAGSSNNSRTNSLGQQSGTFDIAKVQLEAGSVATPFENRPIGTELALCQRYYEKSYDFATAPATATTNGATAARMTVGGSAAGSQGYITFASEKRASSTITFYNLSGGTGTWTSAGSVIGNVAVNNNGIGTRGFNWFIAASADQVNGHWTASAEL